MVTRVTDHYHGGRPGGRQESVNNSRRCVCVCVCVCANNSKQPVARPHTHTHRTRLDPEARRRE